jgi:hypothetical protein
MTEVSHQTPSDSIDIVALIRKGTHFAEKHGDKIHVIECATGNTLVLYADQVRGVPNQLTQVTLADGTRIWTQEELIPTLALTRTPAFNPIVIDIICQKIVEGKNLTDICRESGMPSYTTFCRWRREHNWIEEHIERARRDRAEQYRDKVLLEADIATSTKDPINATNTKIDAYKWAAAIDKPEQYSPKAKLEATVNIPTQIIVATGIDRTPTPPEKDAVHVQTPESLPTPGVSDD